ncbi:MAG: serine protease, partial [Planctomycetes bacterium]|nr:serine protease [Planctomycetota bacterium]
ITNPERFVRGPRGGDFEKWNPRESVEEIEELWAIKPDGTGLRCKVVGFDLRNLLMVLNWPEDHGLTMLKLGNSENVAVGENLVALGNAFDSIVIDGQVSFSLGSLSSSYRLRAVTPYKLRDEDEAERPTFYRGDVLEFEGSINPGDHGGPVIDLAGEVVGLITKYVSPSRQLGTAVPSAQFFDSYKRIIEGRTQALPTLGFSVMKWREQREYSGKVVSRITEGGPAEHAGLMLGDIIQVVDGLRIEADTSLPKVISWSTELMTDASYTLPPGAHISMIVKRGETLLALRLRAGGTPALAKRSKALEGKAAQFSRGQALVAAQAAEHVVQVIVDRTHRPSARPAVRGDDARQAFMDLSVGPYNGIVVSEDGEILIADSILGTFVDGDKGGKPQSVRALYVTLPDGRSFKAEVMGRHREFDLALLKIDAKGLKPIAFRDKDAERGESLAVVRRSFGFKNFGAAMGICSAQNRERGRLLQIDARVGSSDLGALVVDMKGSAVGVVGRFNREMVGSASGVGFASHASIVKRALTDLKAGKFLPAAPRPLLGVTAAPVFADEPGLRVSSVSAGLPAALAGVQEGDIIVKANDVELRSISDLRDQIEKKGVGGLLKLNITRTDAATGNESELELTARLVGRDD